MTSILTFKIYIFALAVEVAVELCGSKFFNNFKPENKLFIHLLIVSILVSQYGDLSMINNSINLHVSSSQYYFKQLITHSSFCANELCVNWSSCLAGLDCFTPSLGRDVTHSLLICIPSISEWNIVFIIWFTNSSSRIKSFGLKILSDRLVLVPFFLSSVISNVISTKSMMNPGKSILRVGISKDFKGCIVNPKLSNNSMVF